MIGIVISENDDKCGLPRRVIMVIIKKGHLIGLKLE